MSKASDEQAKLTASLFNSLAVNIITAAIIVPLVAWITNLGGFQSQISPIGYAFSALLWGHLAFRLHMVGRSILEGLKD